MPAAARHRGANDRSAIYDKVSALLLRKQSCVCSALQRGSRRSCCNVNRAHLSQRLTALEAAFENFAPDLTDAGNRHNGNLRWGLTSKCRERVEQVIAPGQPGCGMHRARLLQCDL